MVRVTKATLALCIANFLGSFTVGLVLGQGLGAIGNVPGIRLDSIFAYAIGSSLSILFILNLKSQVARAGAAFSAFGVVLSALGLWMYYALSPWGETHVLLFFLVMSVLFCCVFLPRSFRSDFASVSGNVAKAEFCYSLGYAASLFLVKMFPEIGLAGALKTGIGAMAIAAGIDFYIHNQLERTAKRGSLEVSSKVAPSSRVQLPPAAIQFMALVILSTMGIQVVLMRVSSVTRDPMAFLAFDVGIAIAPLISMAVKGRLVSFEFGALRASVGGDRSGIPSLAYPVLFGAMFGIVALGISLIDSMGSGAVPVFILLLLGSIIYEFLAIVSFEAMSKLAPEARPVATTFGFMGVSCTAAYALFLFAGFEVKACLSACIALASLSFIVILGKWGTRTASTAA